MKDVSTLDPAKVMVLFGTQQAGGASNRSSGTT